MITLIKYFLPLLLQYLVAGYVGLSANTEQFVTCAGMDDNAALDCLTDERTRPDVVGRAEAREAKEFTEFIVNTVAIFSLMIGILILIVTKRKSYFLGLFLLLEIGLFVADAVMWS